MKKVASSLLTNVLLFALPVLAQGSSTENTIGSAFQKLFGFVFASFEAVEKEGLGAAGFVNFIRIVLIIAAFALFYVLLDKTGFLKEGQKNIRIVLALCLSLLTVVAVPKHMIVAIVSVYSGLFVAIIFGLVFVGGGWLLFGSKFIPGHSRGAYALKAVISIVLVGVSGNFVSASNVANVVWNSQFMVFFEDLASFLTLAFTITAIYYLIRMVLPEQKTGLDAIEPQKTPKTPTPVHQQGWWARNVGGAFAARTPERKINSQISDLYKLNASVESLVAQIPQGSVNSRSFHSTLVAMDKELSDLKDELQDLASVTGTQAEFNSFVKSYNSARSSIYNIVDQLVKSPSEKLGDKWLDLGGRAGQMSNIKDKTEDALAKAQACLAAVKSAQP